MIHILTFQCFFHGKKVKIPQHIKNVYNSSRVVYGIASAFILFLISVTASVLLCISDTLFV